MFLIIFFFLLLENLGAMAYSRYTGFREITDRDVLELHCSSIQSQCNKSISSIQVYPVRLCKEMGNNDGGSVSYDSSNNTIDLSTFCLYIAVKNGFHDIVELLLKAGAKTNILTKVDNVEYSAILLTALENKDLLMIDKLFMYKVEDVNSHVLKKAIQWKPEIIPKEDKFTVDCECLEDIDLSQNQLTALPAYLFTDLPALKSLNASKNKIREFPSSLWHLESLKMLDLRENLLETLPKPGIWPRKPSDTNLEDASPDRKMSVLSNSMADQEMAANDHTSPYDVRKINHWSPKLISDENVKAAETKKGLKTLKLSKNHLREFPDFLSCCAPQLEMLELSKNRLSSLGLLASYPKLLKNLDLSQNGILDMVDWIRKLAPGQQDETYCEHKL